MVPVELGDDEELVVFRIVKLGDPAAEGYVESFLSHAVLGLPPRRDERDVPLIYEGISVYDTREAAVETARRFPRIGGYVAELRIRADTGATYARGGPRGHLTLWGDPLMLSGATVDTIRIDNCGGASDGVHDSR